jgi:cellulose synthase/poly-beta-1,6-N-acetylglucosamine synthase-like glycosyltransferase
VKDLKGQSLSKEYWEVIFVDDHSEDETGDFLRDEIEDNFAYHVLEQGTGKKAALATGITGAKGEYILTTDADCRVSSQWVETFWNHLNDIRPDLIAGPVSVDGRQDFLSSFQTLENTMLQLATKAGFQFGVPSMCNGANLCFAKAGYIECNGYHDHHDVPSGDDEFLMHRFYREGKTLSFLKDKAAIVYTYAQPGFKALLQQKRRWASKYQHYTVWSSKALALSVFMLNLLFLVTLGWELGNRNWIAALAIGLGKIVLEFWLYYFGSLFFEKRISAFYFILSSWVYPFYTIGFALGSFNRKGYNWKGRQY